MAASTPHVISMEVENHIFKHNWIFRHSCIYKQPTLTKSWIFNIFVQMLYSYFRYTGSLFLGCDLFVARCNTITQIHLPTPYSHVTHLRNGSYKDIYIYLLLWVVLCVMISWVNCWKHEMRYENISYNLILHGFLYKQRFFSTHPQRCLAFSRIGLQMLLRCGLIHITIIIHFTFYIWYIVSMSMPRSIKQAHLFFI